MKRRTINKRTYCKFVTFQNSSRFAHTPPTVCQVAVSDDVSTLNKTKQIIWICRSSSRLDPEIRKFFVLRPNFPHRHFRSFEGCNFIIIGVAAYLSFSS
ncbi:hypothetical protein Csa_010257 [Cucumis sativus]|uniref:Uncharacterized protein n=1 Tax=Cucumis sativus TaxID=3659 RepID=A0A0A0L8X8_CUCSA|nr:hypothetical protein Csa_010257 [Cucumis sativus]